MGRARPFFSVTSLLGGQPSTLGSLDSAQQQERTLARADCLFQYFGMRLNRAVFRFLNISAGLDHLHLDASVPSSHLCARVHISEGAHFICVLWHDPGQTS